MIGTRITICKRQFVIFLIQKGWRSLWKKTWIPFHLDVCVVLYLINGLIVDGNRARTARWKQWQSRGFLQHQPRQRGALLKRWKMKREREVITICFEGLKSDMIVLFIRFLICKYSGIDSSCTIYCIWTDSLLFPQL